MTQAFEPSERRETRRTTPQGSTSQPAVPAVRVQKITPVDDPKAHLNAFE